MANRRAMVVCCTVCPRPSVAICVACKRYFCTDHFDEHRRAFIRYVDNAHDQRQYLSECLAEYQSVKQKLHSRIENWKQNLIETLDYAANNASNKLENLLESIRQRFEDDLSETFHATSTCSADRPILIEKLHNEYEHVLNSIVLIPQYNREPKLKVEVINSTMEQSPLDEFIRVGPHQEGAFQPHSVLGKRLVEEPSTTTNVGSYWAAEGSDTHLLVQEYETRQLVLFDRHGTRGISMTWHYGEAVSATRVYEL